MIPTFLHEYGNQNAMRKYPFADDASLQAVAGVQLPVDFLLDVYLCPIDGVGPFYMSALDLGARTMTFFDAGSNAVCGIAQWSAGQTSAPIYDRSGYDREIGMVVFNPAAVVPLAPLAFAAAATRLDPTCAMSLVQQGVRGIISQSDDQLSTGAIEFQGENGVRVTSYVANDGKQIVRIDIIGAAAPDEDDCADDAPPITEFQVINEECTPLIVTSSEPGVLIVSGAAGFVLDNACPPQHLPTADGKLPTEKDSCDPPIPPAPFECPPASSLIVPVVNGQIFITSPSNLGDGNPVRVTTEMLPGEPLSLGGAGGRESIEEVTKKLDRILRFSSLEYGRVTLGLKGPIR